MPEGVVALLVVLAAASPGTVYMQTLERRLPRRTPTETRQIAELVLVGTATTVASATTWLAGMAILDLVRPSTFDLNDLNQFAADPLKAVLGDWKTAAFVVVSVIVILGGSAMLAHLAARTATRDVPALLHPHHGTWYGAVGRWQATHHVFATVELEDGRIFSGYVRSTPVEDIEGGALVLKGDIFWRAGRGSQEERVEGQDSLILPIQSIRLAGIELIAKTKTEATS